MNEEMKTWITSCFWECFSGDAKTQWKTVAKDQNAMENRTGRRKITAYWAFRACLTNLMETTNIALAPFLWMSIDGRERNFWVDLTNKADYKHEMEQRVSNTFYSF